MRERITGVLSPVVTPFKPDLSPDPARLVTHCRWLLSNGVGLAVFGTNSEANSLAGEQSNLAMKIIVNLDGITHCDGWHRHLR